jgi:hypothetical protein
VALAASAARTAVTLPFGGWLADARGRRLPGAVVDIGGYPAAFAVTALIAAFAFGSWLRSPDTGRRGSEQAEGKQM